MLITSIAIKEYLLVGEGGGGGGVEWSVKSQEKHVDPYYHHSKRYLNFDNGFPAPRN